MTSSSDTVSFDNVGSARQRSGAQPADSDDAAGDRIEDDTPLLRIEVVTESERFQELSEDWCTLAGRAGNGHHTFQTFGWCMTWWDSCCDGSPAKECYELRILTGWDDDRLVMVWPMVVTTGRVFNMLRWFGSPLTQYGDILVEQSRLTERWLAEAWNVICGWNDIDGICMRKVRRDSVLFEFLEHRAVEVGAREEAPFVDVSQFADWEAYRATLKPKSRKQQNRFLKNLEKAGKVDFVVDPSAVRAMSLAGDALEMKRSWLERTGRMSTAIDDEASGDFLDTLVCYEGDDLKCHVAALTLNDRPIAIEIGLAAREHYCSFIGAYDPEFAHLRPGNVELEKMIRWALENGYASYDLLAPNDTYKQRWSTGQVEIADFAHPITLRGKFLVSIYMKHLRPALKEVFEAMPETIRSWAASLVSALR